jgi:hypothetical protein
MRSILLRLSGSLSKRLIIFALILEIEYTPFPLMGRAIVANFRIILLNSNNDAQEETHVENVGYASFIGDPYPSRRGIGLSEKSCLSQRL